MNKYLTIVLIGLLLSVSNACTTPASSGVVEYNASQETTIAKHISAAEFSRNYKELNGAILVDVRTPGELAQGYIEGAINLDYSGSNFEVELNKLDKTKPILVYCRSGKRSANTMSLLQEMGFAEVYDLNGGIIAWSGAGLPITK